jgi:hypothetical protein
MLMSNVDLVVLFVFVRLIVVSTQEIATVNRNLALQTNYEAMSHFSSTLVVFPNAFVDEHDIFL